MTDATTLPDEILARRDRAKTWFESLQQRICAELERLEDEAPEELYPEEPGRFDFRPWTRETGVGGGVGGFFKGRLFEKCGIHTSAALIFFAMFAVGLLAGTILSVGNGGGKGAKRSAGKDR